MLKVTTRRCPVCDRLFLTELTPEPRLNPKTGSYEWATVERIPPHRVDHGPEGWGEVCEGSGVQP